MSGPSTLAGELCQLGLDAGLDRVGVCDARPFAQAREAIEQRRREGLSAGMQFTFRNPSRSTDPSATVAGAAALIVGARSYLREEPYPAGRGAEARVARYAWVDHYAPLRQALRAVATRLRAEGFRSVVLADDNSMVDRAAAVRAGIGWYGKNANVLIPGRGSWFVLGSVVTDAPIAPEAGPEPVADGCGTCTRCMSDCPTGAIVAPGVVDARRCLSWLLQAPGPFPVEFREALGDRIYGCDDCQERCPVNRRGLRTEPPPPAEERARTRLEVMRLLAASDAELEQMVGRWYIPGRDLRYVRRNALVVLGNTADGSDPEVVEVLTTVLASGDPLLSPHAAWAAERLGRADLLAGRDTPGRRIP